MKSHGGDISKKRIPKEYLGAFKEGHRFSVRPDIDDDFCRRILDLASSGHADAKAILEFYAKFNNEYYRGVFNKEPAKNFTKERDEVRRLWAWQKSKARDALAGNTHEIPKGLSVESPEDAIITLMDLKKEIQRARGR